MADAASQPVKCPNWAGRSGDDFALGRIGLYDAATTGAPNAAQKGKQ